MNVFKHEVNMKIKPTIIWSISLLAFMIFYMSFFPAMAKDSSSFEAIMSNYPEEMLQVLGVRKGLSLASLMGYFTLTFSMAQLAIAIQSSNYGFSILSEEERELTADFLMSKPISRSRIYFSKFFAALLSLLITFIGVGLGVFLSLELFNAGETYEISSIIKLLATVPVFQLVFLSLGMFISLLFEKIRSVLSFSMALSIGLYVINSVRGIVDSDILGYITPFYYYEPGAILLSGEYDLKLFFLGIIVIAVSLTSSYFLYKRRDINSL